MRILQLLNKSILKPVIFKSVVFQSCIFQRPINSSYRIGQDWSPPTIAAKALHMQLLVCNDFKVKCHLVPDAAML